MEALLYDTTTEPVETKCCGKCGKDKPATEFNRKSASPDSLQHYCKPCKLDYDRVRTGAKPRRKGRKPRPPRVMCELCGRLLYRRRGEVRNKFGVCTRESCKAEYQYRWETANHLRSAWLGAKRRAALKNVSFSLTLEEMPPAPECCPCCDRPLQRRGERFARPELDSIIPEKGYAVDNIQWLCGRCNRLKSDATADELMRLALFVKAVA